MNILIFSWRGPGHPNAGGAEISTQEHAKGWVKAGHRVTLFTSAFAGCEQSEVIDGIRVIRRGRQIFGVQLEAFKWYLFSQHDTFDLVIDQFHGIPFFTPLYIKQKKLAFIHEVTKNVWKLNPLVFPFNLIPGLIGPIAELYFFKFYKNIPFMTVSESTKKELVDYGIPENNIHVIHNGSDVPDLKLHFPKEDKTFIFLGTLSKDKGIEDALWVFSLLNVMIDSCKFWVVGKGAPNYLAELIILAYKLGIDKRIKFWGFVDKQKKFELLSKATVLINTSVREGWGLVVIEAASVGTPTVGYDVAGLKDSIIDGKTGLLCDPNSKACAEAVLQLLNNKNKYQQFRQNCTRWGKEFSWGKSSEESLKMIEKLVNI